MKLNTLASEDTHTHTHTHTLPNTHAPRVRMQRSRMFARKSAYMLEQNY